MSNQQHNKLEILLQEFERVIVHKNPRIGGLLRNGLNRSEIESMFENIGLRASKEIIELYSWRDGLNFRDCLIEEISLFGTSVFYPLKDSITNYEKKKEFWGDPELFPIFGNDELLLNLNSDSNEYGMVFFYAPSLMINSPITIFDSVISMFLTLCRYFNDAVYAYDSNGILSCNFEEEEQIGREMNPNSEYWKND